MDDPVAAAPLVATPFSDGGFFAGPPADGPLRRDVRPRLGATVVLIVPWEIGREAPRSTST